MALRRSFLSACLITLSFSNTFAQTPVEPGPNSPDSAEAKQKALDQKAYRLLAQIGDEFSALKLPDNRVRLLGNAADLLWPNDKAQARVLFLQAASSLTELITAIDPNDPQSSNNINVAIQIRTELVHWAATHDIKLAREIMAATRIQPRPQYGQTQLDPDAQLLSDLANQSIAADPREALKIAEEGLQKGFSYELLNTLNQLRNKDEVAASQLAGDILSKLNPDNLLSNQIAQYVALNLTEYAVAILDSSQTENGDEGGKKRPLLDENGLRSLIDLLVKTALTMSSSDSLDQQQRNGLRNLFSWLQAKRAVVEKYDSAKLLSLQKSEAQFEASLDPQTRAMMDLNRIQQSGNVDAILAATASAPPDVRQQYYQQAAYKALSDGDFYRAEQITSEKSLSPPMRDNLYQQEAMQLANRGQTDQARSIIQDKISNPAMRNQVLAQISSQEGDLAAQQGRFDLALAALPNLRTAEEQAWTLMRWSTAAFGQKNNKLGQQLLEQAWSLVAGRAPGNNRLMVQLEVAQALIPIDPGRAISILAPIIDQLNDLLSAALALNGFDVQYYKDDELKLQSGAILNNVLDRCAAELGTLARSDYDQAKAIADKVQRPEARLSVELTMARMLLAK